MKKLGIIDIGSGNIFAVQNVLRRLDQEYTLVSSSDEILGCTHIILPGVGAFDDYITRLQESGLYECLANFHSRNIYLLGICIGMHVLADTSDEGTSQGLGLISGKVKQLDIDLNLPHMGWNSVASQNIIFDGVDFNKGYYFLHNYHFSPLNDESTIAVTNYGEEISCVVNVKKVYGVQFHPEKSHGNGEILFKNFLELA